MMKLFYSPASPYARKVRVVAMEAGVDSAIELVSSMVFEASDPLHLVNPLGRVPALVLEDGFLLIDSPVICEYLDSLNHTGLYPKEGAARWKALRLQALGDGLMDSAVPWVQERRREEHLQSPEWLERRRTQVMTTLAFLESDPHAIEEWSIGSLAVACAWDYLHFRMPDINWTDLFPHLDRWFEKVNQRPFMAKTRPR